MKTKFSVRLLLGFLMGSALLFTSCAKEELQEFKDKKETTRLQFQGQEPTVSAGLKDNFWYRCETGFSKDDPWIAEGLYYIKSMAHPALNLVLDVPDWNTTNGTIIQQFRYHGGGNQMWFVKMNSDGYYSMSPLYKNHTRYLSHTLDVPNGLPVPGMKIQLYESNSGENQQWKIEAKAGLGRIYNRKTGLALNVPGWSSNPGVQIQQWLTSNQWQFIRVPHYPSSTQPGCGYIQY